MARPISLGDYTLVEQSLHDSTLPPFLCRVRVINPSGASIASVENADSKLCHNPKEVNERSFPIRAAGLQDFQGTQSPGQVLLTVEMDDLRATANRSVWVALLAGGTILFILLNINRVAVDWALTPLRRAVTVASSGEAGGGGFEIGDHGGPLSAAPREIQPLLGKLASLYSAYAKAEGDIRAGKVARQVAHDIRSPLAAMEMVSGLKDVPEIERILMRQATQRIRDIANDLSGRFRESVGPGSIGWVGSGPDDVASAAPIPVLLPVLIDEIVTEMRLRYRSRDGLDISANLDESTYGIFATLAPSAFRRVLCNLIQNAVEAIPGAGTVSVRSELRDGAAIITVVDTGQGIEASVLPRLGERGATFGKPNGSGLGLNHAMEMVRLWGGRLVIESQPDQGTRVRLTLPLADAPAWFVPRLELEPGSHLAILDDDQSIHRIWSKRLSFWVGRGTIAVTHFSSAQALRQWFMSHPALARRSRYLLDFELIGEDDTGLTLTKSLGIESRTILVTSRYEERAVRGPCEEGGIRLIPKGLAPFIPIQVNEKKICAVLIDDDSLTHRTWQMVAAKAGTRILTLMNPSDLANHSPDLDTSIFVDRNLGDGMRGEDVLHELHFRGFTRLYLFTGDTLSEEETLQLDFVSGVVGKTVPEVLYGRA